MADLTQLDTPCLVVDRAGVKAPPDGYMPGIGHIGTHVNAVP